MTVFSRCATVITVEFLNAQFIALQITASVRTSMLAVASSTNTIFVGFKIALAILTNCRSPTLKFSPFSVISVYRPFLSCIVSRRAHSSKDLVSCSSVYSPSGSRFSRMVPANRQGSCRIIVIFERRSSKLSADMSFPSRIIFPSAASRIRSRHIMMVDFPDPVLPTTPILCPPWKVTVSPLRTKSRFFLYLHLRSMNQIFPFSGHCPALRIRLSLDLGLRTSLFLTQLTYPLSASSFMNASHLQREMSQFSKLPTLTRRKYMISSNPSVTTSRRVPRAAKSISSEPGAKKRTKASAVTFTMKLSIVSLMVNHTQAAFLAIMGFLFQLILSQLLRKKLFSAQQLRIVVTPERISEKQLTMGLLLMPSSLVSSLLDLEQNLLRKQQPNKQRQITGRKTATGATYRITTVFVRRKKINTRALVNNPGRFTSTEFRSFESLLKMRPRGTRSKNSFREENSRLEIIDSWIARDIFGLPKAIINARRNAVVPYRTAKRMQQFRQQELSSRAFSVQNVIQILVRALNSIHTIFTARTEPMNQYPPLQITQDLQSSTEASPAVSSSDIISSFTRGFSSSSSFKMVTAGALKFSIGIAARLLILLCTEASFSISACIISSSGTLSCSAYSISNKLIEFFLPFFSSFIIVAQISLKREVALMAQQFPCSTMRPFSMINILSTYLRQQRA